MEQVNNKRFNRPVWYKAHTGTMQVDEDSRTVSGYFSSFGNKDLDGDIILKGAFAKSIQEHGPSSTSPQKIAFLYQHDIKEPIGRITKLAEDDNGLYFEAELDTTPRGNQVLKQYKSGTLNQHSIGFRYIHDKIKYDTGTDAYLVAEVKLFEGSVVTIGANENTPFMGFKAIDLEEQADALNKETETFIKTLDADQAFEVRQLISKHIALATTEPVKDPLLEVVEPREIDYRKIINNLKELTHGLHRKGAGSI